MNDKRMKLIELFAKLNDQNKVLAMEYIENLATIDCLKETQDS